MKKVIQSITHNKGQVQLPATELIINFRLARKGRIEEGKRQPKSLLI